jgi:hypothetical protein
MCKVILLDLVALLLVTDAKSDVAASSLLTNGPICNKVPVLQEQAVDSERDNICALPLRNRFSDQLECGRTL